MKLSSASLSLTPSAHDDMWYSSSGKPAGYGIGPHDSLHLKGILPTQSCHRLQYTALFHNDCCIYIYIYLQVKLGILVDSSHLIVPARHMDLMRHRKITTSACMCVEIMLTFPDFCQQVVTTTKKSLCFLLFKVCMADLHYHQLYAYRGRHHTTGGWGGREEGGECTWSCTFIKN